LLKSFRYAFAGIRYAWRNEPNFRIEIIIACCALALSLWLRVSPLSILTISAIVLSLELVNSALEASIDLSSPDFHPLAKRAKDAAAGAVLVSAIIAVIIGLPLGKTLTLLTRAFMLALPFVRTLAQFFLARILRILRLA